MVGNGVKQGANFSACIIQYTRIWISLVMHLNDTAIGGHIGGQLLNDLCYGNDMCLLSIYWSGMQQVLNIITKAVSVSCSSDNLIYYLNIIVQYNISYSKSISYV